MIFPKTELIFIQNIIFIWIVNKSRIFEKGESKEIGL